MLDDIKKIEGQIMEEINGSKEYLICSEKWSDEMPSVSKMYAEMSQTEMEHAKKLNNLLKSMISDKSTLEEKAVINFLLEVNNEQIISK